MHSPSRIVPAVALVVAVLAAAVLVGACGTSQPSDPPALGTVRVTVHGANAGFFASEQRATLVTPDGRVVADWKLATVGEVPIQAPVGSYTLSTFTVFFSDFMQCIPDPARPGQETLSPADARAGRAMRGADRGPRDRRGPGHVLDPGRRAVPAGAGRRAVAGRKRLIPRNRASLPIVRRP
jgi:hypothetical protein